MQLKLVWLFHTSYIAYKRYVMDFSTNAFGSALRQYPASIDSVKQIGDLDVTWNDAIDGWRISNGTYEITARLWYTMPVQSLAWPWMHDSSVVNARPLHVRLHGLRLAIGVLPIADTLGADAIEHRNDHGAWPNLNATPFGLNVTAEYDVSESNTATILLIRDFRHYPHLWFPNNDEVFEWSHSSAVVVFKKLGPHASTVVEAADAENNLTTEDGKTIRIETGDELLID